MASYTELTEPTLLRLLAAYPINYRSSTHIKGGMANTSYDLKCDEGRFVLTILDNHNLKSARALAELQRYIAERGIPTSIPVPSKDGELVVRFGSNAVMLKYFIEGTCYDSLPREMVFAAGHTLGQISMQPPLPQLRFYGRRLPPDSLAMIERFNDRQFAAWVLEGMATTQSVVELACPVGLVHGDLFADNLIVTSDGTLAVLDWETASIDLLILDAGMAIVGLCRSRGLFDSIRARSLLAGYVRARRLEREEVVHLKDATIYAALVIAYHRYVRHHITHPAPEKQHIYREIPKFVESLEADWDAMDLPSLVG